eukprot:Amastigsp_a850711_5.p3 type:complete len:147 gc:universal Amastigsp_a850711_5:594-1034(+)
MVHSCNFLQADRALLGAASVLLAAGPRLGACALDLGSGPRRAPRRGRDDRHSRRVGAVPGPQRLLCRRAAGAASDVSVRTRGLRGQGRLVLVRRRACAQAQGADASSSASDALARGDADRIDARVSDRSMECGPGRRRRDADVGAA